MRAGRRRLISEDHFSVDGTLLQAWASQQSVHPRDGEDPPVSGGGKNPEVDFHGERRTNKTHVSTADPEALFARKGKGQEARLSYAGHLLMENRNGLILDLLVTQATGIAEREAALVMLDRRRLPRKRVTLDKGYDTRAFVEDLRQREVTPHVTRNTSNRRSAIDGRTTRHPGYAMSQQVRKRIEDCSGWIKTTAAGRKLRYIGIARNQLWATITAVALNLVRMANIEAQQAARTHRSGPCRHHPRPLNPTPGRRQPHIPLNQSENHSLQHPVRAAEPMANDMGGCGAIGAGCWSRERLQEMLGHANVSLRLPARGE